MSPQSPPDPARARPAPAQAVPGLAHPAGGGGDRRLDGGEGLHRAGPHHHHHLPERRGPGGRPDPHPAQGRGGGPGHRHQPEPGLRPGGGHRRAPAQAPTRCSPRTPGSGWCGPGSAPTASPAWAPWCPAPTSAWTRGPAASGCRREFKGLESAPILTPSLPGALVELRAEKLGSLNIGSPVDLPPGPRWARWRASTWTPRAGRCSSRSQVNAPYHRWSPGHAVLGLRRRGPEPGRQRPAPALRLPGAAVPGRHRLREPAGAGHSACRFGPALHPVPRPGPGLSSPSPGAAPFVLKFDESVRGLAKGAPVEFRGMRVGQVEACGWSSVPGAGRAGSRSGHRPGAGTVRPPGGTRRTLELLMAGMVRKGMRAQLKAGSLLTGSLFVDLGFFPRLRPGPWAAAAATLEIPTLPSAMGALVDNLARLAERLQKLPLEEIGGRTAQHPAGAARHPAADRALMARPGHRDRAPGPGHPGPGPGHPGRPGADPGPGFPGPGPTCATPWTSSPRPPGPCATWPTPWSGIPNP